MTKLGCVVVAVTAAVLSRAAHADLRIAVLNDVFTELDPPIDDDGFTQDFDVRFWRPWARYLVGGALLHRWITEIGGPRRRDQLELLATVSRAWPDRAARDTVTLAARLGPAATGNLGGRWLQNGWHSVTGTGPTLDQGLQDTYVGDGRAGAVAGVQAAGAIGGPVQGYARLDGQLAIHAGVSTIEAALGGRLRGTVRCVRIAAHVELAGSRFHVADPGLAIPGGYRPGWQDAYRVGVEVAWGRFLLEYEYRANEGGSGQPVGLVAFTIAQAR